jgi:hypothetical protein
MHNWTSFWGAGHFGTFLAIATMLTLLWGSNILDWYLELLYL